MIRTLVLEITRATDEAQVTLERLDSMSALAERLLRAFVLLLSSDGSNSVIDEGVRAIQGVVNTLNRISAATEMRLNGEEYGYYLPVVFTGVRGRPKIRITAGMLNYFFSHGFSASTTAMLLHVSLSTVRRRMSEYGLLIRSQYSAISDSELDRIVTSVHHTNTNCGYRMMQGYLARLGHRVQQCRVRESMARTDPQGMISRWCNTVQRRYSVASPNQLWHIDGNHRLIR